ncbi:hypothetical protein EI983_04080 [Roseovarius faecimaris]|uniref:DUF1127 domain-containing protein n=1 Tax=Roseovarius faecimaris TaxID=2494550 RepID=A0A6I6IXW9_9RHOB|nr:hypothetical protein [Roseovarius faecimaris]QGX97498.1 hypothetical protein EI983_04080 [Roseovarius faecimaris]
MLLSPALSDNSPGIRWMDALRSLIRKTKPLTEEERHFQNHLSRLAETSPHLLEDIGLTGADHCPATPRQDPETSFAGRHF